MNNSSGPSSGIIVLAEHLSYGSFGEGRIRPAGLAGAEFANSLARAAGGEVKGLVLGHPVSALAREFARYTGLNTIGLEAPELALYNAEAYRSVLVPYLREQRPAFVIIPHTSFGCDIAPRLAAALESTIVSGVISFRMDAGPIFTRPILGGKMMAEVRPVPETTAVITVQAHAARAEPAAHPGRVEIVQVKADLKGTKSLGLIPAPPRKLNLGRAEVIVSAGRGVGGPEGLKVIEELAACFAAGMVGASRPVVDYGWLPYEHQVGQTGQTVAPKLYIACGISGALQHTAGMSQSQCIIAINTDQNAGIFNIARYGAIADLHKLLPLITEKLGQKP